MVFQTNVSFTTLCMLLILSMGVEGQANTVHCDKELEVSTEEKEYKSPGFHFPPDYWRGYERNMRCEVLFRSTSNDMDIEVTIDKIDLEPRDEKQQCLDKIIFYDGDSTKRPVLGIACGKDTPAYQSSGTSLLMVFETNDFDLRYYSGFLLKYRAVGHVVRVEKSSLDAGTIAACVIPAVIIYGIVFVVVYKRCKHQRRAQQDLIDPGHTHEDLVTMLDGRGQAQHYLNNNNNNNNHHHNGNTILNNNNSIPLTDLMTSSMTGPLLDRGTNNVVSSSTTRSEPGSSGGRRGRVRHPAGDHTRHSPRRGRANHLSDSATSLERLRGIKHTFVPPEFPMDPSGVYYAGDVDENGVLHPPLTAPAPSLASSHPYLANPEEDRRSRTSGGRRSPYASGRNSPFVEGGSGSGRNSPYRHRGSPLALMAGTEGHSLTYYGMIDGDPTPPVVLHTSATDPANLEAAGNNPKTNLNSADHSLAEPPPSYDDAASGKYAPTA